MKKSTEHITDENERQKVLLIYTYEIMSLTGLQPENINRIVDILAGHLFTGTAEDLATNIEYIKKVNGFIGLIDEFGSRNSGTETGKNARDVLVGLNNKMVEILNNVQDVPAPQESLENIELVMDIAASEGIDTFYGDKEPHLNSIVQRTVKHGGLLDIGSGDNEFIKYILHLQDSRELSPEIFDSLNGIDHDVHEEDLLSRDNFHEKAIAEVDQNFINEHKVSIITWNAPEEDFDLSELKNNQSLMQAAKLIFIRPNHNDTSYETYARLVDFFRDQGFDNVAILSDIKGYPDSVFAYGTPIIVGWRSNALTEKDDYPGKTNYFKEAQLEDSVVLIEQAI
jgi:hypothetical protein